MTASILLRDVLAYSLQLALIIGAGAALAFAFRIREPRVTLACWRTLLVACLLLPLCQPWLTTDTTITPASMVPLSETDVVNDLSPAAASSTPWPIGSLILAALAAGIAIRGVWLTFGAWTLRRLRRTASPLVPPPAAFREAEARIGVRPGVYVSDRIAGPITFGLRSPIVIVPPSVLAMPDHVQQAIACHELLHVRRRDWIFEVLEEGLRTVFWFHPAIWWLIGRIQLSREQVVDRAAVEADRIQGALHRCAARRGIEQITRGPRSGAALPAAQPPQAASRPDSAGDHHDYPPLDRLTDRKHGRTRPRDDRGRPFVPSRGAGTERPGAGIHRLADPDRQGRRAPVARGTP